MINTTSDQLKILKELIKGKFDTLPTVEINPYQYNLEKNLHNSNNTLELIEVLIDDWAKDINITDILKDIELHVTVRDRAYRIFCRNGIPFKEI